MKKNNVNAKVSTILGKGTVVEGGFTSPEPTRIDGIINGNVQISGLLVLGVDGKIFGDVTADAALIGGEIHGNVHAEAKLEATQTAKIIGDIKTALLVIDENAVFQGKCNMNQEEEAPKKKPAKTAKTAGKTTKKSAKAALAEALKEVAEENAAQEKEPEDSGAEQKKED